MTCPDCGGEGTCDDEGQSRSCFTCNGSGVLCNRCGRPVEEPGYDLCNNCEDEKEADD